jgi:hypothetical protein
MLRVHLQVYVNVGKLKSTLMVSLSQYYKPCNILSDLYTTSCVTAGPFLKLLLPFLTWNISLKGFVCATPRTGEFLKTCFMHNCL